ncbi:MAG: hypothetical protein DLM54_10375 [Acidimicrobiales bacterium]|nr:MAG: hypothetical protein DLM54_10375 [Acidimicrobiales bacterium]
MKDAGSVPTPQPVRQVALLRGINVGRNKRVSMALLRRLLADLGYADVVTYLQSGNAVFTSASGPASAAQAIEQALAGGLGVESKVVVRSHAELVAAVDGDPLKEVATDPSRHLVGFLSAAPDAEHRETLVDLVGPQPDPDQCRIIGNHLYLWCPDGVLRSSFAKVDWNKRLGVTTTMRNWNTVTKLVDLSREYVEAASRYPA